MTTSWPQRLLLQPNVISDTFNTRIGPNPLRPEHPVRETKWLCRPMEVTPAPRLNCPLAMVRSRCSVPTAAPPKPSHVPRQNVTLMHRHRLMHHRCPYLPGALAATNPRSTPSVQPLTRQSTVSGAVEAGQPAADRKNVDRGPTQDMVASELEQPATPATTDDADAWVTVPPGNAVNGEGDHPPIDGPNAHTPRVPRTEDELRTDDPLLQSFTGADLNSMVSLGTPSITTMAVTSTGGLGKMRTTNGNVCTSALSRLVFLYIAYQTVGGLNDFLRCKLLSGATSECEDAIRRKPAFLRRSSFVGSSRRRP
jgi:hypothetical protein